MPGRHGRKPVWEGRPRRPAGADRGIPGPGRRPAGSDAARSRGRPCRPRVTRVKVR
ncbi:hypothetical protein RC1_0292 [Rhodospirillum centenum SW]|uniref:Uncharacterized protein n=1 Tax=Rhodospirillum centenum (strain ATCC 51521 / SW) TaxID=414684 RepID=B6IQK5_RHOCS|nr:hypothetical protein RC1_0292 [Rhodospirillum centenum SW]